MALRALRPRKDEPQEDTAVLLILTDQLNVDPSYQREEDASIRRRAERYAREWDPYLLGEIHAAERSDGTYWVVDGQTRLLAAKIRRIEKLRCFVVRGLDHEGEARLFRRLNKNRTAVSAWADFNAALTEKDPAALAIASVVRSCGFTISRSSGPHAIKAVSGLQKVYALGGSELLSDTLTTINAVWNGDRDASDSLPVLGVAHFFFHYQSHPALDRSRLLEVLSKTPVSWIMRDVKGMSQIGETAWTNTTTAGFKAALSIRRLYNKGLRSRKLPLPVDRKGRQMGGYSEREDSA